MNISARIFRSALILALVLLNFAAVIQAQKENELLNSTSRIQKFVAEYRGLEFLTPVTKKIKTKEQMARFLHKRVSEEYSKEDIINAERLLKRLGLIPPDYNYYASTIDLLTEQISGMYDYQEKILSLASWIPTEMQESIMAHELTHALQDQHYGLENYLSPNLENDDEAMALSSLVEGDATLVMFAYSMVPLGQKVTDMPDYVAFLEQQFSFTESSSPGLASSPRYIKQSLMFSYAYGTEFVKDFLLKHSWNEVEDLFKNPPRTTEQIMHPEKFFGVPDKPQDAAAAADRHFGNQESVGKEVITNVLGEFSTYLLLREHLDEETARKGAEGWDGDLVWLAEIPGENSGELLQMTFCWDSEEDAREFREAYEQYLLNKYSEEDPSNVDRKNRLIQIKKSNEININCEGSTVFISTWFRLAPIFIQDHN